MRKAVLASSMLAFGWLFTPTDVLAVGDCQWPDPDLDPFDLDDDGRIDCFNFMVVTQNQRENPIPSNKNLGVNYGGPNDGVRPSHNGIDVVAARGDIVRAAQSGTVVQILTGQVNISENPNTNPNGNFVRVNHDDGTQGVYLHLQRIEAGVTNGSRLELGEDPDRVIRLYGIDDGTVVEERLPEPLVIEDAIALDRTSVVSVGGGYVRIHDLSGRDTGRGLKPAEGYRPDRARRPGDRETVPPSLVGRRRRYPARYSEGRGRRGTNGHLGPNRLVLRRTQQRRRGHRFGSERAALIGPASPACELPALKLASGRAA